jgi:hypothetical protein
MPVAYACNPSNLAGWNQEDHSSRPSQASPKITRAKLNQRCGSGGKAPALQVWSTEFKTLVLSKKKEEEEEEGEGEEEEKDTDCEVAAEFYWE